MTIIEYCPELFCLDQVKTEHRAFQLLKQNPIQEKIVYLAIPWAVLINRSKLGDLKIEKFGDGFTVCQHVRYEEIIPLLKKVGIKTLFTPHVYKRYWGIRVLPFPHDAVNGVGPAKAKDIFYSFIGIDSTSKTRTLVRKKLFEMRHPEAAFVKERKFWHWARENGWGELSEEDQRKEKLEYQDVLSRSRFSLCPRGAGVSTIRFWESLKAGAIPVLISDHMRLPEGFPWQECVIRIKEDQVFSFESTLRNISPTLEEKMRDNAIEAYKKFSGDNFIRCIRRFYGED